MGDGVRAGPLPEEMAEEHEDEASTVLCDGEGLFEQVPDTGATHRLYLSVELPLNAHELFLNIGVVGGQFS